MEEKIIYLTPKQAREPPKKPPRKKKSQAKKVQEFSKLIVKAMTFLVFATAIFAAIVIWRSGGMYIDSLLNYIQYVGGTAIIGYFVKIAFENPAKIKAGARQENFENYGGDNQDGR